MKKCLWIGGLISLTCAGLSCIKGRIPSETVIPESRIDSGFLQYFRQNSGLIAGEGTRSISLADGRTLWLFGQSHLNDFNAGNQMMNCAPNAHNAAMISDASFVMQTLNNGNADFIPSNETGKWFSPLHGYQYNDTVFIFAKKEGGASLNTRTYVAKFHFPDLQLAQIDSFYLNNTLYGYTAYTDTSLGFCFVYGLYQPDSVANNALFVARFPMNDIHMKWQYYSNNDWVDASSSAQVIAKVPGENFSVRKIKKRYILLTQTAGKACNQGNEIYCQSAANTWGTFLNYHLIHRVGDSLSFTTPVTYGVCLHPQFLNANNEALITYSISGYGTCIPTCSGGYDNPDYYRIRTVRIPLKKLDVGF